MVRVLIMALGLVAVLLLAGQWLAPVRPLGGEGPAVQGTGPAASPAPSAHFAGEPTVIERDRSGQFHLDVGINGRPTRFLIDTGADTLSLTEADARAAGIDVDPDAFQPILRTASGEGWAALVTVDRLDLGDIELRNVGAVVVRDLGVSLLGQSVLARFGKLELAGDRMVLTAH